MFKDELALDAIWGILFGVAFALASTSATLNQSLLVGFEASVASMTILPTQFVNL